MNAKPNIPDYQHAANVSLLRQLKEQGFKIEVNSQGYRVEYKGDFLGAAGTLKRPHGRYREANMRDNLETALRVALNRQKSK